MIDPITGGACLLIYGAMQIRKALEVKETRDRMDRCADDDDLSGYIQAERDNDKARRR